MPYKNINCRLTEAQWDALMAAFANLEYTVETQVDDGEEPMVDPKVLQRTWNKIKGN